MEIKDLGLLALGVVGATIAYLQWVSAHQRVVIDLFDRRRKAFEAVEAALRPIWREGEVLGDSFWKFVEAKLECRFLFGRDVLDYLDKLQSDIAWMKSFTKDTIDRSAKRSKLIEEKYERLNRIAKFYESGAPLFNDYLRLDMKMKYFWPFPPANPIQKDSALSKVSPD